MTRAYNTATTQQNSGGAVAGVTAGKNFIINGGTDIWQRGTSFTPSAGAITQLADRWSGIRPTVAGWTVSQRNSATDSGVAGSTFFMRVQRDSGNTATQDLNIAYNNLEGQSFIPLQGQSITISFWAKAGANYSSAGNILNISVVTGTTADTATWSVTGTFNTTTKTLTTSWQRFSYTIAFGATDKAMRTQFYYTPVGTAGANDFFDIWGLQIEVGSVATPFSRAGGTIAGELAACQRYYFRFNANGETSYCIPGYGGANSATQARILSPLPVQMRTKPSAIDASAASTFYVYTMGDGAVVVSSIVLDSNLSSANLGWVMFNVASGLTTNAAYYVRANNTTSAYLGFSAEL